GPHTCFNSYTTRDHRQIDSRFVADELREIVRSQLKINIAAIIATIKQRYHYTISYKKAWLGKQLALADLFGDWDASYRLLPEWMAAMEASNPGSIVVWHTTESGKLEVQVFQLVFWAFGAAIECDDRIPFGTIHAYIIPYLYRIGPY
ncbi:hypothetical protein CFOL_v3_04845, partial [Cephalotus follicularis]